MIDNLQAGELVHNNSQWHPGDSALGSVPGLLPTGMITPALQTPIQTAAATSADQNLETEDEAEVDEEMDEIDNLDAAFDEDALDEGEEADAPASEEALLVDIFGVNVPSQLAQILDAVEVEQLLSDENSAWEDEDYHLPDLEELSVAEQTDQQTSEGNEQLQYNFIWLTNISLSCSRRRLEDPISRIQEAHRSDLGHRKRQNPSGPHQSTFQPAPNGRKRYPLVWRHPFRCRPEMPTISIPQPRALPTSVEPKNASWLRRPLPNGASQHDRPNSRTGCRSDRKPSRPCGYLDDDKMGGSKAFWVQGRVYPPFQFRRRQGTETKKAIDGYGRWSGPRTGKSSAARQSEDGSGTPEKVSTSDDVL